MNLPKILSLARKHVGNGGAVASSARLCLTDAESAQTRGDLDAAKRWALKSIAYSVGILHADYRTAWEAAGMTGEPSLNYFQKNS